MTDDYIVVDIETTGIDPVQNAITEIGAIKIRSGEIVGTFSKLINPQALVTPQITAITGLTNDILAGEPVIEDVLPEFLRFNEELPLLGQNIMFDYSFLKVNANRLGYAFERNGMDTLKLANYYLPDLKSKSLGALIDFFEIERELAHRAYHDAKATYEVFRFFKEDYRKQGEDILFEAKPLHYRPQKTSPITPRQKSYLQSLILKHGVYLDLDLDRLTKSEASKYIDSIIFTKGK